MQYKYVKEQLDYSDFASGRVFYSISGHPAFPIRLASEIFQRCLSNRKTIYNDSTPCTLYDPCCGTAYHLSVLAYLHREHIREVIGSDVDEKAVALAGQNLGLLSPAGLDKRLGEISRMFELYHKDSHKDALASGHILKDKISALAEEQPLVTRAFQANALDDKAILANMQTQSVDIVFTDIPYGQHSHWHGLQSSESGNPLWQMLTTLSGILSRSSIVAIVSDKQQKVSHTAFERIEHFQIGKRRVIILKPTQKTPA